MSETTYIRPELATIEDFYTDLGHVKAIHEHILDSREESEEYRELSIQIQGGQSLAPVDPRLALVAAKSANAEWIAREAEQDRAVVLKDLTERWGRTRVKVRAANENAVIIYKFIRSAVHTRDEDMGGRASFMPEMDELTGSVESILPDGSISLVADGINTIATGDRHRIYPFDEQGAPQVSIDFLDDSSEQE